MTKLWSTTSLLVLGLLGFLTWTNVEAQKKTYQQQRGQSAQSQGSSTSYNPVNQKTPNTPEVSVCEVPTGQRVPCGSHGISPDQCQEMDCCYEGNQCFFGKTATVHCTRDGYFIVVVARCETEPSIAEDSLRLLDGGDGCEAEASNSLFSVFRFPVSACGTLSTDDTNVIIYENVVEATYSYQTGSGSSITRDSSYKLTVQCRYAATSSEFMNVHLGLRDPPLSIHEQGPTNVALMLANGQCHEKGCSDESYYTSFYTEDEYPIRKALRDPVYVQVDILNKNDPANILLLHRCWATKDAYPHSMPQWNILIDGCPNSADSENIKLVPSDTSSCKRFMFNMFTFVTPSTQKTTSTQQVYIHCSTSVCQIGHGNSCHQLCHMRGKRIKRNVESQALKTVTTSRELIIEDFPEE